MSNESCLLDLLAAPRDGIGNLQRKTIGKCVRQHKRGILGAPGHCEEFDRVLVHRAKMEEKDFIDKMGIYDVVPTRKRMCFWENKSQASDMSSHYKKHLSISTMTF